MTRKREKNKGLTNSRIYIKNNRYYFFSANYTISPIDGKSKQWHSLCLVSDGELNARLAAQRVINHNTQADEEGNFPIHFKNYAAYVFTKRAKEAPKDPPRLLMYETANKNLKGMFKTIETAFSQFNIADLLPVDIASFIDQWEGKRTAQVYQSRLSDFFKWACRKGYRAENPCREISVVKPKKRSRYITDDEFNQVKEALLMGLNGLPTRSGKMVSCYVDLCYLLYQRTTEIRLLRWNQISPNGILFTPTKTEKSSGAKVLVPMSPAIQDALDRALQAYPERDIKSEYVIHTHDLKPYTTAGIGSAWQRATERAGISNATLRDLRAKARTDAKRDGYTLQQSSIGGA
ncbi:MAG: tyrosine-type recombinase/integrase, partial [Burkholderiales bacterium]|nr:tyrosine-type recombinase/integrase [Burkholderiales bacterium]